MEALSLGLLAFATGGFLLKARANARGKKKEGFNNDSLFGAAAQANMPQAHKNFVADSVSYYNPLSALLDANKTEIKETSLNAAENWTHPSPDNATSANLFRSLYSKPGPNGRDFTIDDELGEKHATKYRVPKSYALTSILNTCENKDVRGELIAEVTESNGSRTPIYGANCDSYSSDITFANVCGICHSGTCTNSVGNNISNNNMPKGLFVASRLKMDPTQEELQMQALKDGTDLKSMLLRPTLGSCGIDSNVNKNLFSINKKTCVTNNKYLKCKHNPSFATPNCYMCSTDGKFHFIDSNDNLLSVRQPTTFTLGGNGFVTLQLYNEDGVTSNTNSYLGNPDSNGFLTQSSNPINITLQEVSQTSMRWKIPLTADGEAAAGKYLKISLSPASNSSVPYVQGVFMGSLRSNSYARENTDFTVTALDITSGSDRVFYTSAAFGMQMKPAISNGIQKTSAIFKVNIPYLYISTSNIESTYCAGPFIKNANSSNILSNAACYNGSNEVLPGFYSKECLQGLFLTAGCTINGSGYPSTDEKANALKLKVQNAIGSNANQGQIINNVYIEYQRSWSGLDSTGAQLTPTAWAASQQFCTDSNRGFINPCENLPATVRQNGPLSDECISYIYTNGFYSDSSNRSYRTYSNSNAASLFGENNSMSANVKSQIEPFVGSSKKDRFCTEFGSLSPLAGGSNMAAAKSMGGIANLKAFYNNIHMKANETNMTNAERAQYVAQCYGTDLNVEANADPTISQGIETSATNCGTNGLSLANRSSDQDQGTFKNSGVIGPIRFVRVWGTNNNNFLNFSQLVVLDSRAQNVALNKNTSHHSLASPINTLGSSVVVDGTLTNRSAPNIYHSNGSGDQEYIEVDLGGLYDIVQIIIFNRGDNSQERLIGTTIALYNNETFISGTARTIGNARYTSAPLTGANIQYINLNNPSGPASCPNMLSGRRGNLISGQTTVGNVRSVLTGTVATGYAIYNLNDVILSKSLGGDTFATLATSTAKWIWNHPYAGIKARAESVSFYTNIYNKTNIQQTNYLYYRCDDAVTSVIFNGVVIPSIPSGDWGETNTASSRIILRALPGQNTLQVVCQNGSGRACFIAAIYRAGSWISQTDAGQTNYYSASNAVSETGYSWRSYSEPNIGSGDSGIFKITTSGHRTYNLYGPWAASGGPNTVKWIWNQPDAGKYANNDTLTFYINFEVSGVAVADYTLNYACDDNITLFEINEMSISTSTIVSSHDTINTKSFKVVKGLNSLKISVQNGESAFNPAGFRAYITDNDGTFVPGTNTAEHTPVAGLTINKWICTTSTAWSPTNACVYVPDNATNVPYNCASNVWGSNCTGTFSEAIYGGSISASSGSLNSKTKAAMSTELNTRWGNASMAHGVTGDERNRQIACRGTSVCPTGRNYKTSTGDFYNFCTPDGVADDRLCPAGGYTYRGGTTCERTIAATLFTMTAVPSAFKIASCDDFEGRNCICGYCSSFGDPDDNGDCGLWKECWTQGSCTARVSCEVVRDEQSLRVNYSDRVGHSNTKPCPTGTTPDESKGNNGSSLPRFCKTVPVTGYTMKNPNVNCGIRCKSIRITNKPDYLQIACIAVYDIYGTNIINDSGVTLTALNSWYNGTPAQTQDMVNKIKTIPLEQVSYNGSSGSAANAYHANTVSGAVTITFQSPVDIVGFVYYNVTNNSHRARDNFVEFLDTNGNAIIGKSFGKKPWDLEYTTNNTKFTSGMVQYFDLRILGGATAPTCQPYYNNCPSGYAQQSDGSCKNTTTPTNYSFPQLPN